MTLRSETGRLPTDERMGLSMVFQGRSLRFFWNPASTRRTTSAVPILKFRTPSCASCRRSRFTTNGAT